MAPMMVVLAFIPALLVALPAEAALPSNCWADSDGNGWKCVKVTSDKKNATYNVADTTIFENSTDDPITGTCSVEHSRTWTYGVTASISASAGVIFAKVDSAVAFNLQHSRTSAKSSSVQFTVQPGDSVACDSGVYNHKFKGKITHTRCSSSACKTTSGTFSLKAPSKAKWRVRYF